MLKYLFITINALTVFIYSLFSTDGAITITNTIPTNIKPGQTVAIEIKVSKGSIGGFAKLQLDLPEGLSITEVDNKGSNFSYSDGLAKWVWSSLPTESDIIIKANLIASAEISGVKTVGGKYSYVENNVKQVVEMTPVEITTGNSANQVTTTTPTETTVPKSSNAEPIANVTSQRTLQKISDTEYLVTIKIKKGNTKGFARYSDDLPENLTAKSSKMDGASFSVADGKLKYVWVTVPEKEELEIAYTLLSSTTNVIILNGEYSFLEENQSKKYKLQPESINFVSAAVVANTTPTLDIKTPTVTAVETKTEVATTNTNTAVKTTPTETLTDNASNQTNANTTSTQKIDVKDGSVIYKVQIGAFSNSGITSNALAQVFNIKETIKSEFQGGFSKFMIGNYAEYKAARDGRESVKTKNAINGAFVVAYNGAKRITVQEALMISNQKWFK